MSGNFRFMSDLSISGYFLVVGKRNLFFPPLSKACEMCSEVELVQCCCEYTVLQVLTGRKACSLISACPKTSDKDLIKLIVAG